MKSRYLLALLLAAGACAGAPKAKAVKPGALPASVFLGTYPPRFREWTQKQWAAMPLKMRQAPPPTFRVVTSNELKKLPGLGGQESTGAYDTAGNVVYTRSDLLAYHERFLGHELGHHAYYFGADPKKKQTPFLTQAQRNEFHAWVRQPTDDPNDGLRENYQLIPQYTHLIQGKKILDRELSHEKFAHAFLQVYWPGGGPHPAFGKAHPAVEKKIRGYSPP